ASEDAGDRAGGRQLRQHQAVTPGVADPAGDRAERHAGDRRQLGKALRSKGRNTSHPNAAQNRLCPASPEAPLRPSGGRGRDPSRVSLRPADLIRGDGRVRRAAPRTGTSAPFTLPSPPGPRGERVSSARFEAKLGSSPDYFAVDGSGLPSSP